jgi:large subunit ribosomal protein L5e
MGFVKVIKNKAYFKRFQVKYRRRREGKTDYYARVRMITQDKNKYNSPKYRLVVRFTNQDVIAQIVYSKIVGDVVVASAYGHELTRYGMPVGHTNYASAYAVGLLLARRHLTNLGLNRKYQGVVVPNGEDQVVEVPDHGPRPFLALLDIGLARTTTGARIFSVLKGAVDGGLNVPHSEKRFFGYNNGEKTLDAALLRKAIFGGHIAEYMKSLSEEEPSKYKRQFSRYIKAGLKPDQLENAFKNLHTKIRANPALIKTKKKKPKKQTHHHQKRLTLQQRRERVKQKLQQMTSSTAATEVDADAE